MPKKTALAGGAVYLEFAAGEPVPYALAGGNRRTPNGKLWAARVEIPGVADAFLTSATWAEQIDKLPTPGD